MTVKPTENSDWGVGNPDFANRVVEPSSAKKVAAWLDDERPPAPIANWLWHIHGQWIRYLDEQVTATAIIFDAIVGSTPESTHATLNEVMADGAIGNGARILVVESSALDATQTISKANVRISFKSAEIEYTKGGGAPATNFVGINITAAGVIIESGRFDGFEDAGDKVFNMTGTADYGTFRDCRFAAGQTQEIDESAVNPGRKPRVETTTEQ